MPDFLVDFSDLALDGIIVVHDAKGRKKPLVRGDTVKVHDASGNVCFGIVDRGDSQTSLYWLALDRTTYKSVTHA